jgi:hypothetical protein
MASSCPWSDGMKRFPAGYISIFDCRCAIVDLPTGVVKDDEVYGQKPDREEAERGHPVRLSAKRELIWNITGALSVLHTLADKISALQAFFEDRAVTTGVALPDGGLPDTRVV